jgi:hypothetical protein
LDVLPLLYFAYIAPNGEIKRFIPETTNQSYSRKKLDNTNCSQTGLQISIIGCTYGMESFS